MLCYNQKTFYLNSAFTSNILILAAVIENVHKISAVVNAIKSGFDVA